MVDSITIHQRFIQNKQGFIELIRFVSFCAICFNHVGEWALGSVAYSEVWYKILKIRSWGVPLFFIISGFLLKFGEMDPLYEWRRVRTVFFPWFICVLIYSFSVYGGGWVGLFSAAFKTWLWFVPFYLGVQFISMFNKRILRWPIEFFLLVSFFAQLLFYCIFGFGFSVEIGKGEFELFVPVLATLFGVCLSKYRNRELLFSRGGYLAGLLLSFILCLYVIYNFDGAVFVIGQMFYSVTIFLLLAFFDLTGLRNFSKQLAGDGHVFYYSYLIHGFLVLLLLVVFNFFVCGRVKGCLLIFGDAGFFSVSIVFVFGFLFVVSFSLLGARWLESMRNC